jgi:N-acetylglutamate synthase-like GNAT family acetyltransferase
MVEADLDEADRVMRLAFGTIRGLPDPTAAFGEAQVVRTRFRAAPECAWVAELDTAVVGSVFATRWGSFAFFGPLTVHPSHWDRSVGSALMEPVLDAFARWDVRQAGLFTFPSSPKHLGLYQKHGFWPRFLTAVLARAVAAAAEPGYERFSAVPATDHDALLEEARDLTGSVFGGLDVEREIVAASSQGIGDTVLIREDGRLTGLAVCHCGGGSEADSGVCYVKFACVRPGRTAAAQFERLLAACEALAAAEGLERLVAGVNTGRLDAYRRLLDRGFRTDLLGVSMRLRPEGPDFDTPASHVLDDLR